MVETLLVAFLSCSEYQRLIDRVMKSPYGDEVIEEVVQVYLESAPDYCEFDLNDEST